jgi:hypothetical protein
MSYQVLGDRANCKLDGLYKIRHSFGSPLELGQTCATFIFMIRGEGDNFFICNNIQRTIRRLSRYQREVIRIRKSKKNKQYNGQKKKDTRTNNDLQNVQKKLR